MGPLFNLSGPAGNVFGAFSPKRAEVAKQIRFMVHHLGEKTEKAVVDFAFSPLSSLRRIAGSWVAIDAWTV